MYKMLNHSFFCTAGSVCLTFAYHMYGQDIGTLEVLYEKYSYFYMVGDQGKQWRRQKITLTSTDYTMNHKVSVLLVMFRSILHVNGLLVCREHCLVFLLSFARSNSKSLEIVFCFCALYVMVR